MYINPDIAALCGSLIFVVVVALTIWALATLDKVGDVRERLRDAEEKRENAWEQLRLTQAKMSELRDLHADLSRQHEALIASLKK